MTLSPMKTYVESFGQIIPTLCFHKTKDTNNFRYANILDAQQSEQALENDAVYTR